MQDLTLIVSLIFVERIAIVITAFVCVFFGWNLFRSNIYVGQDGNISIGEWKVELKRVGPGIFFSLFGAAIVVAAFMYPMKFSTLNSNLVGAGAPIVGNPVGGSISVSGLLPGAGDDQMRFVRAINTIGQLRDALAKMGQPNAQGSTPISILPVQASDLVQAANRLDEARDRIVVEKFGADNLRFWQENHVKFHDSPMSLDAVTRTKMAELDQTITPWMTSNMSGETK